MSYKKLKSDVLIYDNVVVPVYREVLDTSTGRIVLKKVGETNTDKAIQKAAESCDLKTIVSNLVSSGTSLPPMVFGDVSKLPDSLPEAVALRDDSLKKANDAFSSLPDDFKSGFSSPEDLMYKYNQRVIQEYIQKKEAEKMKSVVGEGEVSSNGK